MGRVTFYSSSRRSHPADRRAQFKPQGPSVASAATEEGAAGTEARPRQRGRVMKALKQVEKPFLIAAGGPRILELAGREAEIASAAISSTASTVCGSIS